MCMHKLFLGGGNDCKCDAQAATERFTNSLAGDVFP